MFNLSKESIKKYSVKESNTEIKTIIPHKNVMNSQEEKKDVVQQYDIWDTVKDFYIKHSSRSTYIETARKFNLDVNDIAKIAKDEEWFEKRITYWSQESADFKQNIYEVNKKIFRSLAIVAQFAIGEHAKNLVEVERAKQEGASSIEIEKPTYAIKDAMALVKLFDQSAVSIEKQISGSDKELGQMDDSELDELLSEDEKYELDEFYKFETEEEYEDELDDDIF